MPCRAVPCGLRAFVTPPYSIGAAQACARWHLHAPGMCAPLERRRLRRLVLPLPRLPLRSVGSYP